MPSQTNKKKGEEFENCIADLLTKDGWKIYFNRDKGKLDEGIDLIAKKNNVTALIQCKYRGEKSWTLNDEAFNKLFTSAKTYEIKNPKEKVHCTVVTTGGFYKHTKEKAATLGIELIEAKQLGLNFKPTV